VASIPKSALILALSGVLPFAWSALTILVPSFSAVARDLLGPSYVGIEVLRAYGIVILAFMAGVFWGFATKATGRGATTGYALSVLPALYVFFAFLPGPDAAHIKLIIGFLSLLGLDWHFWRLGLAPPWWLRLRILITVFVIICLTSGFVG